VFGKVPSSIVHSRGRLDLEIAARSEGLKGFDPSTGKWSAGYNDAGSSFGPYQMHFSINKPGFTASGLGDRMFSETGIDVRKMQNWKSGIDYALDTAAKEGWGAWHGAAAAGVGHRQGLSGARPVGVSQPPSLQKTIAHSGRLKLMARGSKPPPYNFPHKFHEAALQSRAARYSLLNDSHATHDHSQHSSSVSVGNVNVHTSATDATGIAADMRAAMERELLTNQANYGLA
jgi:hypothetical protein